MRLPSFPTWLESKVQVHVEGGYVSPVFRDQKVWIDGQGFSVKLLSPLSATSVEMERPKVCEQSWVWDGVDRLLVHLRYNNISFKETNFANILIFSPRPLQVCTKLALDRYMIYKNICCKIGPVPIKNN